MWYFDEAGFSLTPSVPYAWQPTDERIESESPGNQRERQNVLGFVRWDGAAFYAAAFEGHLNNHLVAGCIRQFAAEKKGTKPKLIVLDNAPAHRGDEFEEEVEELGRTRRRVAVPAELLAGVESDRTLMEEDQV